MASSYWSGKVALVTGASKGLGKAIAQEFLTAGARVAIAARDGDSLRQTANELKAASNCEVLPIIADVTRDEDVNRLVHETTGHFGQLDVLVNNVGISSRGEVLATTPEEFQRSLDINLLSTVRVTRVAAEHLIRQRGHLVNIGSLASKTASRYMGAYPASKFALAAYSHQLRLELAPQGLHVLLVCPGPIARDETRQYTADGSQLPKSAQLPGAGVKLSGLAPEKVARAILRSCERRDPELVMPAKARLLFALAAASPRLGDWILRKMT